MRVPTTLLLVLLGSQGLKTRPQDNRWIIYTNVRFQYALCYPRDLFVAQGETENYAGNTFEGKNGEEIIVDGESSDLTLSQLQTQTLQYTTEHFGPVVYRARVAHGFVFSARNDKSILYAKTLLSAKQYKTFSVTYPVSEKSQFDPIIKGLSTCFSDLNQSAKITFPD